MHLFKFLRNMYQAKKAESMNRSEIVSLNKKRLRKILEHVLERSEFYRDYYRSRGITRENLDGISLTDIPLMDKKTLMQHFDAIVCASGIRKKDLERFIADPSTVGKKFRNCFQVVHSSGSSGRQGIYVYGPDDWDILRSLVFTRGLRTGVIAWQTRIAAIVQADGHFAGINLGRSAPPPFFRLRVVPLNRPLAEIVRELQAFQPEIVAGYASAIPLLADEQIKGNLAIRPRRIICSAEPLTPEGIARIRTAFGLEPINLYAASESVAMGVTCTSHGNLHLFDDWHCFEVIDRKGRPAKPGMPGTLIMTNLYNRALPLIRYRMNDEVWLAEQPCPCGWPFLNVNDVSGRSEEILWFTKAGGSREHIHPLEIVGIFIPGLEKFQLIQSGPNQLLVKVVVRESRKTVIAALKQKLTDILSDRGLEDAVEIVFQAVDRIETDSRTGKFRLIVPLRRGGDDFSG